MHGSRQGIVEDLWCAFSDYLDRMHARADVAFNDATVQYALTAEVRQLASTPSSASVDCASFGAQCHRHAAGAWLDCPTASD